MTNAAARSGEKLYPLNLIQGCNTPLDQITLQFNENIQRDLEWLDFEPPKARSLVIVGGGPSLEFNWPLIPSHEGDVLALNGAYPYLLEKGITPDYFMLLDARQENVDFVRSPSKSARHFIAAQCHPDVFEALEGFARTLYLTTTQEAMNLQTPYPKLSSHAGTVGMKAISLAYVLGYRELHLYGYDSSHTDNHHAFPQSLNDASRVIEVVNDGKTYLTSPSMAHQAREFASVCGGLARMGFDINIHCSGLLPDLVRYCNEVGEIPLEQREQEKYEKMWRVPGYRNTSPAEFHVESAISELGELGKSVFDFGCGPGRATKKIMDSGYEVTGIDIAANALEVDVPFIQSCLWQLPDIHADWGICVDVMEHIPTEKVVDVLQSISERCEACYFNIATREDNFGGQIGQKLHLTVASGEDWQKLIGMYWSDVKVISQNEDEITLIGRAK